MKVLMVLMMIRLNHREVKSEESWILTKSKASGTNIMVYSPFAHDVHERELVSQKLP